MLIIKSFHVWWWSTHRCRAAGAGGPPLLRQELSGGHRRGQQGVNEIHWWNETIRWMIQMKNKICHILGANMNTLKIPWWVLSYFGSQKSTLFSNSMMSWQFWSLFSPAWDYRVFFSIHFSGDELILKNKVYMIQCAYGSLTCVDPFGRTWQREASAL